MVAEVVALERSGRWLRRAPAGGRGGDLGAGTAVAEEGSRWWPRR